MLLGWHAGDPIRGGGVLLYARSTFPLHPTPQKTGILGAASSLGRHFAYSFSARVHTRRHERTLTPLVVVVSWILRDTSQSVKLYYGI